MKRSPQQAVDAFNAQHPRGTAVEYRSAPGSAPKLTATSSPAWVLSGHTAVVMVDGVSGCVALDALTVR